VYVRTGWIPLGEVTTATGETSLYSGNPKEEDPHTQGVGHHSQVYIKRRHITFIQCYAPANTAYEVRETFYQQLQAFFQSTPKKDKIVMGDLNARIGKDNADWRGAMGRKDRGSWMTTGSSRPASVPSGGKGMTRLPPSSESAF
jgi:exonuclease III